MIIGHFDAVTIPIAPNKTDSELIIHSDRVLALAVSLKSFQLVPWRRGKHSQFRRCMKLKQFPQGHPFKRAKAFAVVIAKKRLGFGGAKTLNHTLKILRIALYVNRSDPPILAVAKYRRAAYRTANRNFATEVSISR
jgi:hypothetical protein